MSETGASLRKFVAPEFIFGNGARMLAGQYARNLGLRHVLLVTGPHLMELPWPHDVMSSLKKAGVGYTLFSDILPNPRDHQVMAGAETFRKNGCDALVAVGGGSPMDCAKAIGIVVTNDRDVLEFEGADNVEIPGPPLICVPTTSGSAADVSQFSIISDTARKVKIAIVSKTMIPDVSMIDPETTTTKSPELTAHTGLDALTHAIEAYVSNAGSPFTDLHAHKAVQLVGQHLLRAINKPDDMEARAGMALASTHAGLAFSNAILGAVHALAHSLGGYLDLPHGQCNALLLDHVMACNFDNAADKYFEIGRLLGAETNDESSYEKRKMTTLDAVASLKRAAGVTQGLAELGVSSADFEKLAEHALLDPCMLTNPKEICANDIRAILEAAQ
ncbi:alcohol dehydrogenase-like regulatory protein ErcA [Pseudodesulfovibrio senegalensis]|uniref:Iron-containing alcohol dehydrogenase n=1 Tax=Pseudodesulfovibrio senegalensis TaxID=1721087 RepID=A0A6N6N058_9BACT|nr:alcohol dehydrogenase-like regulatory protein ErcA [Pseudodesulfovibrio senegalensis]KAB1440879.1 iron-containing alcohol dehydrogenase [Pseudodesulfovibrio senegalensis]